MAVRGLVMAGVLGWALIVFNFGAAFILRKPRTLIRFTWALAALGAGAFLLSRLGPLPLELRILLDVGLSMGGVVCGLALTVTLLDRGFGVLK